VLVRHMSGPQAVVAMLLLATLVGALSYVFLEKPVTNFLKNRFFPKKPPLAGVA
jgi:peptidoglycan/LPS O-acetylase OafA/YrhL